jgi:hypothetical protein
MSVRLPLSLSLPPLPRIPEDPQAFEKLSAAKVDSMQKFAADAVGPKLEQLVTVGREKVARLREEGELRIVRRSNELRKELQGRFEVRMKSLTERSDLGETTVHSTHEKRLQQAAQRYVPHTPFSAPHLPHHASPSVQPCR